MNAGRGVPQSAVDEHERAALRADELQRENDALREALREAREAAADDAEDAARWRAMLASQRVRVLGTAHLGEPYAHIGLELWGQYPGVIPSMQDANRSAVIAYADGLRKAQEVR